MKITEFLPWFEISHNQAEPKNASGGNALKSLLIIFVLSYITLLTSCVVAVPDHRYQRQTVVVERNYSGGHHDRGEHRGWYKHHSNKKHYGNDDRHD